MFDLASAVPAALGRHRSVRDVRLIGSRAEGRAHELSDWDFAVETDDFGAVAGELPALVAGLSPLAEQWDRYSSYECYMLMLPGPVKVDLLFLDQQREWSGPWSPSPDTLEAIDRHFWDWILWLEQKRRGGREDVVANSVVHMHEFMLDPMGVVAAPKSVSEALDAYLDARSVLERQFGIKVPRGLEREVRPGLEPKVR